MNLNPENIYIEKKEYEVGLKDKPRYKGEVYDFRYSEFLNMYRFQND
jgi:hypothetical protein